MSAAPASQPVVADVATTEPYADGQYMTLGGVVAEVNGTPIFANQILSKLDKMFAAKAREMPFPQFQGLVMTEVQRQRKLAIADELEYAAAQRLLTKEEKQAAHGLSVQFRQQKVTEAGGSEEAANRRAMADGETLDELMQRHYRETMRDLFYQRHIFPRVQVTADDMRAFYDKNVDRMYSQHDQAQYRVIKIDPAKLSGDNPRAMALQKIADIRKKAERGDDFAALASLENHDDYLKSRGGDPGGWMQRGAYRVDEVDKAVWTMQDGQISDVIDTGDAFYIVKLEAKKPGKTRPFEDPTVQDDILARLRQVQFVALRESIDMELLNEAVIREDDDLLQPAIDMALQKYPRWASR